MDIIKLLAKSILLLLFLMIMKKQIK